MKFNFDVDDPKTLLYIFAGIIVLDLIVMSLV